MSWHFTAVGSPFATPKPGEAHVPGCPGCEIDTLAVRLAEETRLKESHLAAYIEMQHREAEAVRRLAEVEAREEGLRVFVDGLARRSPDRVLRRLAREVLSPSTSNASEARQPAPEREAE